MGGGFAGSSNSLRRELGGSVEAGGRLADEGEPSVVGAGWSEEPYREGLYVVWFGSNVESEWSEGEKESSAENVRSEDA